MNRSSNLPRLVDFSCDNVYEMCTFHRRPPSTSCYNIFSLRRPRHKCSIVSEAPGSVPQRKIRGFLISQRNPELPAEYAEQNKELYELVNEKYRVDEFYDRSVTKPLMRLAEGTFFKVIDRSVIDNTVNKLASVFRWLGARIASTTTGAVRTYIAVMVVGLLLIVLSLFT